MKPSSASSYFKCRKAEACQGAVTVLPVVVQIWAPNARAARKGLQAKENSNVAVKHWVAILVVL
jgi:hypothetical protein